MADSGMVVGPRRRLIRAEREHEGERGRVREREHEAKRLFYYYFDAIAKCNFSPFIDSQFQ